MSYRGPELVWVTAFDVARRTAAVEQLACFVAFNSQFCTVRSTVEDRGFIA